MNLSVFIILFLLLCIFFTTAANVFPIRDNTVLLYCIVAMLDLCEAITINFTLLNNRLQGIRD